jgi:hypothetical protein
MKKRSILLLSLCLVIFSMNGQSLPKNFNERLTKNCAHASFIKRLGFFTGRMATNVLFKQTRVESYKVQQSYNLAELSAEIWSQSLVYDEVDKNSGNAFRTEFKTIIDYLPTWNRKLTLKYPNRDISNYTVANLDLNKDEERQINSEITLLVTEMDAFYRLSMQLINEARDKRNLPVELDFQQRYEAHFGKLEAYLVEYKTRISSAFSKIQNYQESVNRAEALYVQQLAEELEKKQKESAEQAKKDKEKSNKEAKIKAEKIMAYLKGNPFAIPYEVNGFTKTKECKYCGKECEVINYKIEYPDCDSDPICLDAFRMCCHFKGGEGMTAYLLGGGEISSCKESYCSERSGRNNHVWHQVGLEREFSEKWIFKNTGVELIDVIK